MRPRCLIAILSLCLLPTSPSRIWAYELEPEEDVRALAAFSDPSEAWGQGIEAALERAYRRCFKTYILGGSVMTLPMPFAQHNERSELSDTELAIEGKGKADPEALWRSIDELLASEAFLAYAAALSDGLEKVIIFDLAARSWSSTRDVFEIARMKAGAYRGLPHRPYVLARGVGVQASDVYNYIFCVGRIGMDCSGFVWHTLQAALAERGVDLGAELRSSLRAPRGADPSLYAGAAFFDSGRPGLVRIKDSVGNLRPGDVLLFRGEDGKAVHSAVIQSIDRESGTIRYLQSTDEAPLSERGVHESFIRFNPARPDLSLKDPRVEWTQTRFPPFPGEKPSAFSNDGERYRAYPEKGGGAVVRLRAVEKAFKP